VSLKDANGHLVHPIKTILGIIYFLVNYINKKLKKLKPFPLRISLVVLFLLVILYDLI
jgi:hypothetical protein